MCITGTNGSASGWYVPCSCASMASGTVSPETGCSPWSRGHPARVRGLGQNVGELLRRPDVKAIGTPPTGPTVPECPSPLKSTIAIEDRCTPEFLAALAPTPGIGAFSRYSPQAADRQHAALMQVAALPHGRVLVAYRSRQILAYLTFHPPERDCRWASLPFGQILELGGIEVARGLRGMGLARRLMNRAFAPPGFDDIIVYAQALTWCWDLEGTGMSMAEYRQMMLRLFGAYGFEPYVTDEPNIHYDRSSLLLARVGPMAPPGLVKRFQALLIQGREDWSDPPTARA